MSNSRKIILCTNAEIDKNYIVANKVGGILKENGWNVVFCPAFVERFSNTVPLKGYENSKLEDELANAEMIITLGGDGTILHAARACADAGVPILGINIGGKGFMAELEPDEVGLLASINKGDYTLETRIMLDVEVYYNDEMVYSDFALNDIVIRGDNKVIELTLYGDGQKITHFSGDGAVIATPTGSTAYSMSAGGPIVDPAAKNIIITPICAHVLGAKSFVLVASRIVTAEIGTKKQNPIYISVDGGDHVDVKCGAVVKVHKSDRYTQLVRLSDKSFYRKVSEKLGERG